MGEGKTVWKRETWRENRDTRKEGRYPTLFGVASLDHTKRDCFYVENKFHTEGWL